jgi:hypothetical protein
MREKAEASTTADLSAIALAAAEASAQEEPANPQLAIANHNTPWPVRLGPQMPFPTIAKKDYFVNILNAL